MQKLKCFILDLKLCNKDTFGPRWRLGIKALDPWMTFKKEVWTFEDYLQTSIPWGLTTELPTCLLRLNNDLHNIEIWTRQLL